MGPDTYTYDYQPNPKLLSLFQLISQGGPVEEHGFSVNEAFDLISKELYSYPLRFQYGFQIEREIELKDFEFEFAIAWLYGITDASPDNSILWNIEFEF